MEERFILEKLINNYQIDIMEMIVNIIDFILILMNNYQKNL